MLNQILEGNLLCGLKIGTDLAVNHLQFADDTLLFCENEEGKVELLCNVLVKFLFASGMKVNLSKSSFIGCNVIDSETERIANIYGWRVPKLPVQYLGAPLG